MAFKAEPAGRAAADSDAAGADLIFWDVDGFLSALLECEPFLRGRLLL